MSTISTEFSIDIILHSLILFTFLSLFYMFYICEISKKAFDNEISNGVEKLVKKFAGHVKDEKIKEHLKKVPYDFFIDMYKEQSEYVSIQNDWLFYTLKVSLVVSWTLLIFIIFLLKSKCGENIDIFNIVKNNCTTFIFVGLVEYMFFTNVATKFIPMEPSVLTDTFFSEIKKIFKN